MLAGHRLKRAILFLGLFGCTTERAHPKPPTAPVVLAPLAVKTVIRRVTKEWLDEDSPFVVVLTRQVEPVPNALALVDDAGASIEGETTWLDRQVVAFYPKNPVPPGLDLHLRLVFDLRAKDGSKLLATELATAATRTLESSAYTPTRTIHPIGEIRLAFDGDRAIPAAEVERLGALSDEDGPIPFVAREVGSSVSVTAQTAFRPGASVLFGWKSGPIAKTSRGRMHLVPVRAAIDKRLSAYVGDTDDHCHRTHGTDDKEWVCKGDAVHISFSAPIANRELTQHAHPALQHATRGDLRGHRVEITLGEKPVTILLDAKLEDVFGQQLKYPTTFVIRRAD